MKISEDTLLAYVDGELDAAARDEVEAAIAGDPQLAQRVRQEQGLRGLLRNAYDPVLDEPMPARLLAAAQGAVPTAKVLDLAAERASRTAASAPPRAWAGGWPQWGAMAACLIVGIFVGRSALIGSPGDDVATRSGQMVARGELAHALSTQLASAQAADAPVQIGLSFVSRGDAYCRTFALRQTAAAGLACRHGEDWQLRVWAQDKAPPTGTARLRMAASPTPPAVLRAVDEQIEGSALDAEAERAALQRGWRKR
ncbi:anti-sigma factor family protein [Piscinibacter sp.]|jgi:hypothetical protein|uniref:anti-sigma factor family protein n=1 Tax=Piscinibacter sp. TaxID=1903157 RepID=UPI003559A9BE